MAALCGGGHAGGPADRGPVVGRTAPPGRRADAAGGLSYRHGGGGGRGDRRGAGCAAPGRARLTQNGPVRVAPLAWRVEVAHGQLLRAMVRQFLSELTPSKAHY